MSNKVNGSPSAMRWGDLLGVTWREIARPREAYMLRMAADGELLVAGVRLATFTLLLTIHLFQVFESAIAPAALTMNLALVGWAALALVLVRRHYAPWMSWASSLIDVSLVSLGLVVFLAMGRPDVAVNSRILFEAYLLMIAFCALRYDWRLCALTGAVAALQYLTIVAYASSHWDINAIAMPGYDGFNWGTQGARVVMLLAATAVIMFIAMRGTYLRRQSLTDALTGLHNRGYFDERAQDELQRARRYSRPLTVALLDIDHFKQINDSYGHHEGDQALRLIAGELVSAVRSTDVLARIGGEEFAMAFPESTAAQIMGRLEAIRERIANATFVTDPNARITVSMGVAAYPDDGEDMSTILNLADERLFAAKEAGRNQVMSGWTMRRRSVPRFG